MIKKLYEDSNNKLGKHKTKNEYWKRNNIEVVRSHRLSVGDYMLELGGKVSVDTKKNLTELATNFFCEKDRFEKECIRAKNNNVLLIFLIEENFDKDKLLKWRPKPQVNGKRFLNVYGWQVYNEMKRYSQLFGVKFRFCHKLATGRKVIELLEQETKRLELKI